MRQGPNLLWIMGRGGELARDEEIGGMEETKVVGPWRGGEGGEGEGGGEKGELGGR